MVGLLSLIAAPCQRREEASNHYRGSAHTALLTGHFGAVELTAGGQANRLVPFVHLASAVAARRLDLNIRDVECTRQTLRCLVGACSCCCWLARRTCAWRTVASASEMRCTCTHSSNTQPP